MNAGGLSAPRGADQGNSFPPWHVEIEPLEDLNILAGWIVEEDVVELDVPLHVGGLLASIATAVNLGHPVDDSVDLARSRTRGGQSLDVRRRHSRLEASDENGEEHGEESSRSISLTIGQALQVVWISQDTLHAFLSFAIVHHTLDAVPKAEAIDCVHDPKGESA